MIFLAFLVLCFVIWAFACRYRSYERSGSERAKDILAERYARGEITSQEFREGIELIHE